MNIGYIKSTGVFIKGVFFALVVSLMALASCSDDDIESKTYHTAKAEQPKC